MITIDYSPLPGLKGSVLAPIIPVIFTKGKHEVPTFALVDSGAAGAVISTVIADELGIDWMVIPPKIGSSVGGNFRSHLAKVNAKIFDHEFELAVYIIEGLAPYKAILGQRDIFKRAKIIFEGYKNKLHIDFRNFN
jgi:hypothetical protein